MKYINDTDNKYLKDIVDSVSRGVSNAVKSVLSENMIKMP